jgi:hypothetical protein
VVEKVRRDVYVASALPLLYRQSMRILSSLFVATLITSASCFAQDVTPSPSPEASASPKKTHRHRAAAQMSPTPAPVAASVNGSQGPVTAMTPATGGGNGQVWVNSATHVYHKEGSRFYGKTKHGKYMSEQDAIKEGDHAAKNEH